MTLQRRTIKRNTAWLQLQLRKIKHHDLLHLDKDSKFSCPKGREAFPPTHTQNTRLHLLGPLKQVFFDRSSHSRRTRLRDSCKDMLIRRRGELALTIAHEGKSAFHGLPKADWIYDGMDDPESRDKELRMTDVVYLRCFWGCGKELGEEGQLGELLWDAEGIGESRSGGRKAVYLGSDIMLQRDAKSL